MTTHSFTVDDEALDAFRADVGNKSETIREALRVYRFQREGIEDSRLSDRQRTAYEWLRESAGDGGRTDLKVAQTVFHTTDGPSVDDRLDRVSGPDVFEDSESP